MFHLFHIFSTIMKTISIQLYRYKVSLFYQSIFVYQENLDTVFFTFIISSHWYNFLDFFSKTYILDQTKPWEYRLKTNNDVLTVPNLHSHYWCGASGQPNCAISTEYLKDTMAAHQNISRGSNHVPRFIKRQGAKLKKHASTASQNYLCNKSIHCPYLP